VAGGDGGGLGKAFGDSVAADGAELRINEDDPDLLMDEDLYFSYRGSLFTGVMTEFYPNGAMAAEVGYGGGKPEGWGRSWYDDGMLKSEHFVKDRRVVGVAKGWHANGVLSEEPSDTLRASAAVFDAESLEPVEAASVEHAVGRVQAFALNFEETLACVEALRPLTTPAGLIVCPGNGPNHTIGLNLATHLGMVTGRASFGVSDTAYAGTCREPGAERGAWTELVDDGAVIGRAVRTQAGREPVFVTYGHRLDLDAATEMTLRLTRGSRVPTVVISAAERVVC
jgi:deoxyribonuclease V